MWPEKKKKVGVQQVENTLWGPIKICATAELFSSLFPLSPFPPLLTYTVHNHKGCMYVYCCCCCSNVSFECTRHWLTWKEMKQKTKLVSIQFLLRSQRCNRQRTAPYTHTCTYMHQRVCTRMYMCVCVCVCATRWANVYISTSPNWIKIYPKKKKKEGNAQILKRFFERFANKCFPVFLSFAMFLV